MSAAKKHEEERMTPERMEAFLEDLRTRGRSEASIQGYRQTLTGLYNCLPEGKLLSADTAVEWKDRLEQQGFSPRTVNARMSTLNSFLLYLGHRDWQSVDFLSGGQDVQPELTRAEYLRLLQAAKLLDKEKSYLLIKTMGGAGLRIQELPQLTAETVRQGLVRLEYHNRTRRRVLRIPRALQEELLDYIKREGIESGPIFINPAGTPMARSSVYYHVNCVSADAKVQERKASPRCLWKMHQNTFKAIQSDVNLLIEQAYERLLEDEQLTVGWRIGSSRRHGD